MNNQYLLIINLIKDFIWGEKLTTIPRQLEIDSLFYLSDIHAVSGIIAFQLRQYPLTEEHSRIVNRKYQETLYIMMKQDADMKQLLDAMGKIGIDCILFKGYAIKELYPVPWLRTFGDIDIIIKKTDRKKSNVLMIESNFKCESDWEPVYSYRRDNEHYEIHTEVLETDIQGHTGLQKYFSSIWNHAIPERENIWTFDPEYHLLYLLVHLAKHISGSGAGIRMYLDIALFVRLYREKIDWNHFATEIKNLGLEHFVNTVFCAVEEWFSVKTPIPTEKKDEKFMLSFLEYTMESGVFGFDNRSEAAIKLKGNTKDAVSIVDVNKTIYKSIFPPVKELKKRYTYLQNRPWLLPIAWAHRIILNRHRIKNQLKLSSDLMTVEEAEVIRLKKIMHDIGL